MSTALPNCDCCGRFVTLEGSSSKMAYSGFPPAPDREIYRCAACTQAYGPIDGKPATKEHP